MRRAITLVLLSLSASLAHAQSYPTHPIKLVIPWPPGQATDLAARMVAEKMTVALGQPIVADNKGGAGGTIGVEYSAKQPADGYTIVAGSSGPVSISPNVQKVGYDPVKDFSPIILLATNPFALVVNPSIPAKNAKELIAVLKASPGKYSFGSSGSGATAHLMVVLFNQMAGVDAVHVPYKGSSQSVTDVVSGQIAYTIETIPAILSYVKSGRLRALAVTSSKRSTSMPELPTIAEAALPGYNLVGWIGLMAPAATPLEVRKKLASEAQKALALPDVKQRFLALGLEPEGASLDQFEDFIKAQTGRYGEVAKKANIHID